VFTIIGLTILKTLQHLRQNEPTHEINDETSLLNVLNTSRDTNKEEKNVIFLLLIIYIASAFEIFIFTLVNGAFTDKWNNDSILQNNVLCIAIMMLIGDIVLISYVEQNVKLNFLF
jgi:hypothetical protein